MAKVVPKSRRRAVFEEAHAGVLAGHFNARKIFQRLRKEVFWEGMRQDITLWCKQCRECFLTNNKKDCRLRKEVFWEGMRQDITLWCKQCRDCFLTNNKKDCVPPL
ncbi:hypothetical protein OSTOST_04450 [Ostertagia ostertagi]